MLRRRIDVHQHIVPPAYADWLASQGVSDAGGRELPAWSADEALTLMGRHDIATAVVSISTPGVHLRPGAEHDAVARAKAREVNEFAARLARDHPGRFGFFAMLPVPAVDAALEELSYAFDVLRASGVILLANVHGRYLGAPEDEPLFAELDRRHAVVFVHPSTLPGPRVEGIPPTAETQRPPFEVLDDFASFYFDTALSGSPAALPSLLAFAKPGHVLFGSDWPYAPEVAVSYFTAQLDDFDALDADGHAAVDRRNVEALLPSLAHKEIA